MSYIISFGTSVDFRSTRLESLKSLPLLLDNRLAHSEFRFPIKQQDWEILLSTAMPYLLFASLSSFENQVLEGFPIS